MENKRIHILCTRPVDAMLVSNAVAKGFDVDTIEFINTVAINNNELQQQVKQFSNQSCLVIFTSMNAVEAVIDLLGNEKPSWKIFCMGNTTKQLVIKYFGEEQLISTGINATELANAVVEYARSRFVARTSASESSASQHRFVSARTEKENNDCLFFCGDQRREELPGILKANKIALTEITVYKTIETSQAIEKNYDAILFFSPSAVDSFFKQNRPAGTTIFFAIGETTASAIKQYSSNKIIVGNKPAKDELFNDCVHQLELQTELNTGNP